VSPASCQREAGDVMTVVSGMDTCPERLLLMLVMKVMKVMSLLQEVVKALLKVADVFSLLSPLIRTQTTTTQIRACSAH